ncbi:MAG: hypothetical protein FWE72_08145 [Spirochaetaceae bacterium]|nr:hypothetical protein [Spirochaetaceae bacterium]
MYEFLEKSFPLIKRVRGYRLYTNNNEKYLDFYQEGGKAILGSKPRGFSLALKNEIEKSNFYNYPSGYLRKIEKGISKLAEECSVNISYFKTEEEMCRSVSEKEGKKYSLCKNIDCDHDVLGKNNSQTQSSAGVIRSQQATGSSGGLIYSWFPFCGSSLKHYLNNFTYVLPVFPFPGDIAPIVLLSSNICIKNNYIPSPVVLSGLNNIIYNIIRFLEEVPYIHWREYTSMFNKIWRAKGPYLIPVYKKEVHELIFKNFLKNKILIQPCFGQMSVLPAEISEGERILFLDTAYNIIRSLTDG